MNEKFDPIAEEADPEAFICKLGASRVATYRLCDHLGWQTGEKLGTVQATSMLWAERPTWFWDRPSQRLLDVRMAHPVVAALIYSARTGTPYSSSGGDKYLEEHMGFWISSVAVFREVLIAPGFVLN